MANGTQDPDSTPMTNFCASGKKKTNKHKHCGRDGVRDKQEPSLGQRGPLPGTNSDPSLGQTGLFLLNSTVKALFCPVCPWDGWGSSLGRLSHKGRQKNVYVFFVYWFFVVPSADFPSETCLCNINSLLLWACARRDVDVHDLMWSRRTMIKSQTKQHSRPALTKSSGHTLGANKGWLAEYAQASLVLPCSGRIRDAPN